MQCSKPGRDEGGDRRDDGDDPVDRRARAVSTSRPPGRPSALHMMPSVSAGTNSREALALRRRQGRQPDGTRRRTCTASCRTSVPAVAIAPTKLPVKASSPVEQKIACLHLAARPGHDDQVVAGEQLGAANHDQNQAQRERRAQSEGAPRHRAVRQKMRPRHRLTSTMMLPALTVVAKIAPKEMNAPARTLKHQQRSRDRSTPS